MKLPLEEWKQNIPLGMRALPRWVGHYSKRPVNLVSGSPATVDNPKSWGTFEQAMVFYADHLEDENAGVGFVFVESDGLVFVDFDKIEGATASSGEILTLLNELSNASYCEVSPSGKGRHVFLIGRLPEGISHVRREGQAAVEAYSTGRYSTVTGQHVPTSPKSVRPADLDPLLRYLGQHETPVTVEEADPGRLKDVVEALSALDPDMGYDEWLRVGMALKSGLGDAGRDVWLSWCYEGKKHVPGEPEAKWDSFQRSGVGLGTLFHMANAAKPAPPAPPPEPKEVFKPVAPTAARVDTGALKLVPLSEVKPEKIDWLWRGRLAIGHIAIIAGDPGKGKSIMCVDIAARVSRGGVLPGDSQGITAGRVLLLNAEDGQADTLRPRAEAAGADLTKLFVLDLLGGGRPPQLPDDVEALDQILDQYPDTKLLILDPLNACIPVRLDSHKDQHIRQALQPLAALAQRRRVAVALVAHLNKANDAVSTLYRVSGSIGIGAAARSVLFVGTDPDDEDRRVVAQAKPQLGPPPPSLAFGFKSAPANPDVGMIEWHGETQADADDLTPRKSAGQLGASKVDDAMKWLEAKLGPAPASSSDVFKEGKVAGFGKETLKAAAMRLGVEKKKESFGGAWMWSISKITEVT